MYVNYSRRMIYLAHPRTASRATRDALIERFGFRRQGQHHSTLGEHPDGWTVFTTIRNHYDAWASWYCKNARNGERMDAAFVEGFVGRKDRYFPVEGRMWGLHAGVADVLLRYESLEADLSALLGADVTLGRVGGEDRNGRDYREIIEPSAHAYIGYRYEAEIEEYGYGW